MSLKVSFLLLATIFCFGQGALIRRIELRHNPPLLETGGVEIQVKKLLLK